MPRRSLLLDLGLLSSGRRGCSRRLLRTGQVDDDDLDAKLELGLCGTVELFVNSRVFAVEVDIGGDAVGIAFEDDVDIRRDGEELTELPQ